MTPKKEKEKVGKEKEQKNRQDAAVFYGTVFTGSEPETHLRAIEVPDKWSPRCMWFPECRTCPPENKNGCPFDLEKKARH